MGLKTAPTEAETHEAYRNSLADAHERISSLESQLAEAVRERDEARLIAERQRGFIFELESEQRQARSKLERAERERDDAKVSLEKQIEGRQEACMWAQDASSHIVKLEGERDEARAKLERCVEALEAAEFWVTPGTSRGPASDHWVRDIAKMKAALAACRKEDK